jgi:hypothetical protein
MRCGQGIERKSYRHYSQAYFASESYSRISNLLAVYPDVAGFLIHKNVNKGGEIGFLFFSGSANSS